MLEANFNFAHRIVFSNWIALNTKVLNTIPIEVIGERRHWAAIHLSLDKKLVCDNLNARKLTKITICADEINCYDRVTHLFTSLHPKYFRTKNNSLRALLRAI